MGRPKANFKDIPKALCLMSYNGRSYRRTRSDLKWMFENELIKSIPPQTGCATISLKKISHLYYKIYLKHC